MSFEYIWWGISLKLSASYNFFNGEEHLIPSIKCIRDSVDFISIVYQKTSNSGNFASQCALDTLSDIRASKLADDIIEFHPDFSVARQQNELKKRSIGLDLALKNKCTHFFTIDADEFYRKDEFEYAKEYIKRNRVISSSVNSFFHLKTPHWRSLDSTCCAFITKIDDRTEIGGGDYYIDMVDPTRGIKPHLNKSFLAKISQRFFPVRDHVHFPPEIIAMYHMNFVRKDQMGSKLANTSTTDTDFLEKVRANYLAWEPGTVFSFPNKRDFTFDHVANEFETWSPE